MALVLLVLAVLLIAEPTWKRNQAVSQKAIVVLLDRSASMGLTDDQGKTRLEAAREVLIQQIRELPGSVPVALVTYDIRAEILAPMTLARRSVISQIQSVTVRPIAGNAKPAVEIAGILASLESGTEVWHFSDEVLPASTLRVREWNVALPAVSNSAITAFQLRPIASEYGRFEAFVGLALNENAPEAVEAQLSLSVGGLSKQLRKLTLSPGQQTSLTIPFSATRNQIVTASLQSESDAFPLDDEVRAWVPSAEPVLAAWIRPDNAEDPYTRLALSSIQEEGKLQLLQGNPDSWPLSEPVDFVVFDGWLPEEWPEKIPALVINPPATETPFIVKRLEQPIPVRSLLLPEREHPVLFRVSSSRLTVAQTGSLSNSSLTPLWQSGGDTILAAGEIQGSRVVVLTVSPMLSNQFPLTASFPVLLTNAIYWCLDQREGETKNSVFQSGTILPIPSDQLNWKKKRKNKLEVSPSKNFIELSRVGIWSSESGDKGSSYLLSYSESNLPVSEVTTETPELDPPLASRTWAISTAMLCLLLLVLLLDSFLFHRLGVY